jgi:hypothetical protein
LPAIAGLCPADSPLRLRSGQARAGVPTFAFLSFVARARQLDTKKVVEKVVKGWKGLGIMEVIENGEKINFKKCHSCPMLCDIMII